LNKVEQEILLISQEECAEVTQAISKVFRFGFNDSHNGVSNKEHLNEEVGDLLCMIDLMIKHNLVNEDAVLSAKSAKLKKLNHWSSIKTEVEV
jgi:NTP pyrophosphatase (non-canonical NTP hydrolase)